MSENKYEVKEENQNAGEEEKRKPFWKLYFTCSHE